MSGGLTVERIRTVRAALIAEIDNTHYRAIARKRLLDQPRRKIEPARKMPRHWQFHVRVPRFWLDRMRPVRTNKV